MTENPQGKMKYRIESDDNPLDPRKEFDNLGVMVCLHKRYDLGDEHDIRADDFICWESIEEHLIASAVLTLLPALGFRRPRL